MPEKQDQPRENAAQNDAFRKIGPTGIEGVEASDLPDDGRGPVETDPSREAARQIPGQTGGTIGGERGLRGHPDMVKSDARGGRKKN